MGNTGYGWIYVAALGACFWWSFVVGSLPSDQFCSYGSCAPVPKHSCPDLESPFHPSNTITNYNSHLLKDTQIPPPPAAARRYPTLQFTTQNETAEYYCNFIETLRGHLASGEEAHAIRVMRDRSSVPDSERFVLVELSNHAGEQVTIAIDVVDAYVVAYQAGDVAYFFDGSPEVANRNLFTEAARRQNLSFDGSYGELENVARASREDISLGRWPLDHAIGQLRLTETFQNQAPVANALMVIIQMISEAARFNHIVRRATNHMEDHGFTPDRHMLWLENNWKYISKMIQKFATEEGIFLIPFEFRDVRGRWQEYFGVAPGLIINMGLMLFICTHHDQVPNSPLYFNSRQLAETTSSRSVFGHVEDVEIQVCPAASEPTVRIIGRDLRCVTVKDGGYYDGTALVLSSCRPDDATNVGNQLWTLKRDGTIQSNGKCMTAYGFSPQQYVMIYNCKTANTHATKWKVWSEGAIANPYSALVLHAHSSDDGTELQVRQNNFSRAQGWLTTNATKPPVTPISSFTENLCLQETDGLKVRLDTCVDQRMEQQWALYPDGSIRRRGNEAYCLGFDSSYVVLLLSCEPADDVRRWVFDNDGSINNLHRGLAMEVKDSNTVIVNKPNGALNQRWFICL